MHFQPSSHTHRAIASLSLLLVLSAFSKLMERRVDTFGKSEKATQSLVKKAIRYHKASLQDTKRSEKLKDSLFASAYLEAARFLSSDASILSLTGVEAHSLSTSIDSSIQEAYPSSSSSSSGGQKKKSVRPPDLPPLVPTVR